MGRSTLAHRSVGNPMPYRHQIGAEGALGSGSTTGFMALMSWPTGVHCMRETQPRDECQKPSDAASSASTAIVREDACAYDC